MSRALFAPPVAGDTAAHRLCRGLLAALVPLLAACGTGAAPPADNGVVITHIHGTTRITGTPQRVVALSAVDADTAAALGVTPLVIAQAPGTRSGELSPWFAQRVGGANVEVIPVAGGDQGGGVPFERVAAAQPDLILALGRNVDATEYATLSGIAPTVPPKVGDFLDPWQDITRTIGVALGRPEDAERLVAQAEAAVADAAAAHPQFRGRTFVATLLISAEQFGVLVDTQESTVSLMSGLGFRLTPEVDALVATTGYAAQLSRERAALLDADVTLAYAPQPGIAETYRQDPLVQRLDVVRRGAFVEVDQLLWGALRNPSVLSIPYAVDRIVPRLAGLGPST
ncbi:MAG TPA: ABC transporter substrate-binding protein [Actinophytocola sp.]|nr:ABC transporter substrate-binding protein [Actinophytocola sp.]